MIFLSPQSRSITTLQLVLGLSLFALLAWSAFDYGGRYLHVQAFAQALTGGLLLLSLSRPLLASAPPLFKSWGLWGLILALGFAFSGNRLASLEALWRWLMYAGVFWSAYTYAQSPRQRTTLTTGVLLIGCAVCAMGWLTAEAGLMVSSFHRTNDLAGYLLLLLPLGLQVTLTSQRWLRILGGLSSLLFLASLIATNSRSSWASAAISLALFLWLNRKSMTPHLWRWLLGLLGAGTSLGLILFAPKVLPRMMTLFSITQENATAWRLALLDSAWKIFMRHPFTGSGPNTFASAIRSVQEVPGYYSIDPHNFYLLLLAELGIFGLLGFVWLIYQLLHGILRQPSALQAGILTSLSACLIHIAFDIEWSVSAIPILFFTLAGMGLSPQPTAEELSPHRAHLWRITRFGMGLVLLILPALNLFSSRAYQQAAVAVDSKDYLAARAPLQTAMRLAPWPSARHYRTLAEIECAQKQPAACLKAALQAAPLDRYNNESLHIASQALHLSGDRQGALKLLEQAVLLNPVRHPSDYTRVGDYYQFIHKDNALALTWYQRGAKLFTNEALRRYESYTVGDRYESYTLLKRIAGLADVMGNTQLHQESTALANTRLDQEPVSTKFSPTLATPVISLRNYWKGFIRWQNEASSGPPHALPGTSAEAPIPYPLKQSKVDGNSLEILEARRSFSEATLIYQISLHNAAGQHETLRIKDHLQLGEDGWYIVLREPA